jgi:hypothetical protein
MADPVAVILTCAAVAMFASWWGAVLIGALLDTRDGRDE